MSSTLDVRANVLRGLLWKGLTLGSQQFSRIAVGLILARLLTPHDFGVATMVLVFSSLVIPFADLGLGAALVQRRSITPADISTAFWLTTGVGAAMTVVGWFAAGPIANFYDTPQVEPLFEAMSVSFLVVALGTTQTALLTRELKFRALELRNTGATLAGAALGIGLAAAGYGSWAIIGQQLASCVAATALLWIASPWRPTFRFSTESLRGLGTFGGNVFGQRLLYYAHRNSDNLLIGKFIGSAQLGAYSLAYNVMLLPFSRIGGPIQQVMYPVLALKQHDRAWLGDAWVRVTRVVGSLTLPALAGLIVVAPDFVDAVLGAKWDQSVELIQILAWVGMLQSLQTLNADIFQALDRTGRLLRYYIVFFLGHLLAFAIGLHWGVVGVAAAYAVSSTILEPTLSVMTARTVGTSPWRIPRALAGITVATIAMASGTAIARWLLVHHTHLGPGLRLLALVAVGTLIYVPACLAAAPDLIADLRRLRGPRNPPSAPADGQAAEASA